MSGFGARVRRAFAEHGQLCVGIDPHDHLLSAWGMHSTAADAREFGLRVVEAATGRVGIVKPQVSFFERFGSAGFAALEDVLAAARAAGLVVIADAKRGDIGSTMDAYARAWLAPGSPLEADALTVNPYLGPDTLRETIAFARQHGKGVFVLAATSNPDAAIIQSAHTIDSASSAHETVAARIVREIVHSGDPGGQMGAVGVVVGATVDLASVGLHPDALRDAPILAPGFGAQGVALGALTAIFGDLAPNVIANESRGVLGAGQDGLIAAIDAKKAELGGARG